MPVIPEYNAKGFNFTLVPYNGACTMGFDHADGVGIDIGILICPF